ncbi:hypothetical protein HDU76_013367 [Blyttiomyces sp. JEL0837]|nr:hypothetical protein HDU76_013367 [Blyttiomyces sp. JEL0837]
MAMFIPRSSFFLGVWLLVSFQAALFFHGNLFNQYFVTTVLSTDFPNSNGQPAPQHTQLQLYSSTAAANQFFKFVPTNPFSDDNTYTIVHYQTGYCMDALTFGTQNGDAVGLYPCSGNSNQMWSLKPYNGGYLIVGVASNRCVNELSGNKAIFDKITLWDCVPNSDGATNMVWSINDAAIGKFWSQLRIKDNMVLDFPSPNLVPSPQGTQLQIYASVGDGNVAQQYHFESVGDGYYHIVNRETGWCVDVANFALDNNSPVGLYPCHYQDNQKWQIQSKGLYAGSIPAWIVGKQSGKCLSVLGGTYKNGDKVGLFDCVENNDAIKWEIGYNIIPDKELGKTGRDGLKNVELLWGNVNSADKYPDFYQTLLSSRVFEMLGQYGIGRGSYKGSIQLPPNGGPALPRVSANNGIAAYLHQLTQLGYLKPNDNTYYAIHFGQNTGITCDGYCAYHTGVWIGDIANQATNELIFGVMPDLNGCNCGGNNVFEAQTMAAAHELIEAVTDPWGGYVDPVTNVEIGDLCSYRSYSITGSSGKSYLIQRFWSNIANTCVE